MHFVWKKGSVTRASSDDVPATLPAPPALAHFDGWTADAEITGGAFTVKNNQLQQGKHGTSTSASVTFTSPPKVSFALPTTPAVATK
jgi:hypothetical protein